MKTDELLERIGGRKGLLVLIDLCHFSQFNGWLGHIHADKVLDMFYSILEKSVRQNESNFVFRWGGDEYIVFLEGMVHSHAHIYLDRLRTMSPLNFDATFISHYSVGIDSLELIDNALLKHKKNRDEKMETV